MRAAGIDDGAAGKAVVHRRGRADHLVDGAAAAGRQRPADDRDDAGAGRQGIAPRSRDGQRQVADPRRRRARRQDRQADAGGAKQREVGGRIPADQLGVDRRAVGPGDVQAVLAAERARGRQHHVVGIDQARARPSMAAHLHDGRGDRGRRIGELVRDLPERSVLHEPIVDRDTSGAHHPNGRARLATFPRGGDRGSR
jgi:hypothetical protein